MNLIGSMSIVDSIVDFNTAPALNGAFSSATIEVNGRMFVYVAGNFDNGIQILEMGADGSLTEIGSFFDDGATALRNPRYISAVEVGNNYFLVVPSSLDDSLTTLRITETGLNQGLLGLADTETNGGDNALNFANYTETFSTPNGVFVAVTAFSSGAVSVYRIAANGAMTLVDVALDSADQANNLAGTTGVSIQAIGNRTFLYAAGQSEDAITVFEIANNGTMSFVTTQAVPNSLIAGIETGRFNGQDYLIVTNTQGGTFEIFSLAADGTPTFVSSFAIFPNTGSFNSLNVRIVEIEGVSYILSTGDTDDSVSIYTLDDAGTMSLVQIIRDATLLDGANTVEYVEIGGRQFLLAAAIRGDRITSIEIGAGDDTIVGTAAKDRMVGLAGDDDMIGLGGADLIKAGDGDDVLSGRKGNDRLLGQDGVDVLVGGVGNDELEGGAGGDFLLGGNGVNDSVSYRASTAGVTVNLATGAASGGDAAGDYFSDVESIIGSGFRDVLTGDAQANTINGGAGNDTLSGGGARDMLFGEKGNDTAMGGNGNDVLKMGGGRDTAQGDAGNDRLFGGAGNDTLFGNEGDDTLRGGGGADRLIGGAGDDILDGGNAADIFVFATVIGGDTIEDFQINIDKIDMKANADYNSFADILADSFEFMGNTVIGGGSDSIQLIGVARADLDQNDFIFV